MKEVEQIALRLKDQGVVVEQDEIEKRFVLLVDEYHVSKAEATRSVLNYFLKEHGITPKRGGASEQIKVAEIKEPGRWVDLNVKVLQLTEPNNPSISQTGLIGDETGNIRFVKWTKSDLPDMIEGKSYFLKNVVTDQYQNSFSIKLNRTSEVKLLDSDIEASGTLQTGEVNVSEITDSGRWVNLKVKVVQLWDTNSESISQSGLVGDNTGVIKFVKWAKAELPDVAEGKSYFLKNVVTDEFQGRFSIKLNRTSEISEIDEQIEVISQTVTFIGALVDVQKGSGLIKRCPLCKRALAKGICGEHGKVEGTYDLRIKAALDDGETVQDVLINRERTEGLLGITLEDAKRMAVDALDAEIILGMVEERVLGRYFKATGPKIDRYLLVESIEEMPPLTTHELEELIEWAEVA